MKNTSLIVVLLFVSVSVFAQKRNEFTGPEHKNYKPWMHKAEKTLVFKNTSKKALKGSEIKNQKVWETSNKDLKLISFTKSNKTKLTGPAYKNYKPWKKD
ncbi:hypothetical protein [Polaribacter butkevichii]|uniref:Uncharacterized protein n=1 Tax=Polaribacter butkevichii TaxID=218490 RepID=A0A2P6CBA9_9FLAO|nr:hypothetical protein [Polaribacter butkevichii]PQJ72190.1 hypothetical protein BTO14_02525 [Polaribacter butkevichii]